MTRLRGRVILRGPATRDSKQMFAFALSARGAFPSRVTAGPLPALQQARCTSQLCRQRANAVQTLHAPKSSSSRRALRCSAAPDTDGPVSLGLLAVRERHRFLQRLVADTALTAKDSAAVSVHVLANEDYSEWCDKQAKSTQTWLSLTCPAVDNSTPSQVLLIPEPDSLGLRCVLCLLGSADSSSARSNAKRDGRWLNDDDLWWKIGALPTQLPPGYDYTLVIEKDRIRLSQAALAWALGSYSFDRCKSTSAAHGPQSKRAPSRLVVSEQALAQSKIEAGAIYLARDLINTPAAQMSPFDLEMALCELASSHAEASSAGVVGNDLLASNFPMIHAVGRGSMGSGVSDKLAPRLVQLKWREHDTNLPLVALVGKGVCFDTGGLDLKPAAGMRNMKKDMGGAAAVLATADMIMSTCLNVRLNVFLSCVENAVSSDSFRPGDVLTARNGVTTEIDNTDAEGRLVMADALVAAGESEGLALVADIATLTGAQRVALGSEIGSVFGTDADMLDKLAKAAYDTCDPLWPLPMYDGYASQLKSTIADVKNCGATGLGGAITAALYLKRFAPKNVPWLHFDVNGFNNSARPGRPEGGEAFGARALFAFIRDEVQAAI